MRRREFLKGVAAVTAVGAAMRARHAAGPGEDQRAVRAGRPVAASGLRACGRPQRAHAELRCPRGAGARFQRCYATNPLCTPNRSCIITGRFPHQTGMIHNDIMLPPENRCIAESFAAAGYATHYVGKWHMDGEAKPGFVPAGGGGGFRTFEGFNRGHYYPTGAHYFTNEGNCCIRTVYEPQYQTNLAIEFMKQQKEAGKPFYCYLSWGPPHMPYHPPAEWDKYDPGKLQWRPNVPDREKATRRDPEGPGGVLRVVRVAGLPAWAADEIAARRRGWPRTRWWCSVRIMATCTARTGCTSRASRRTSRCTFRCSCGCPGVSPRHRSRGRWSARST